MSGIRKNPIVEDAPRFYARARQELPESAMVPARMVLTERGAALVERSLAEPPQATPPLVRLMKDARTTGRSVAEWPNRRSVAS